MNCAQWTGAIVVACLIAGGGVAVAQPPTATPAPLLAASLETCATGLLSSQRVAAFVGSMPAIAGGARMQMRFDLQRRRSGEARWLRVRGADGFGIWEKAKPGRAGFVFHKRVDGLRAPLSYRALVRFRWLRADGTIVRREQRRTRACEQPDLRPDLSAGSLRAVLDARPATAVYTLVVRNDGRTPAGPFTVRVGGGVSEVPGLAAGRRLEVVVVSAACVLGSTVEALVDADGRVDEAQERNALRQQCPLRS
ncbi:MAG: hypothetical protein WKF42_09985 [Solirubrobacteraceae bacterium]